MKITSVEIIQLSGKDEMGEPVCCIVNTDEGIKGYGEFGMQYGLGKMNAVIGLAKDFAEYLIGMDPLDNEKIWEKFYRKSWWGLNGGAYFYTAVGGFDIALWDIKGKALNAPVYMLLGGKTNEKLRAYASQLQYGWSTDKRRFITEPEEYAQAAITAVNDGYDCFKVDPIYVGSNGEWPPHNEYYGDLDSKQIRLAYNRIAAMRDAVGDDIDIICEMHCLTNVMGAVKLGQAIEDLNIMLYEEAVAPSNPDMLKVVSDKVNIPIAFGERLCSRWDHKPFFDNRSINVIQPDLGNAGGFTEVKKICDMANIYDVRVQAHVAGGPIANAAGMHIETAIPNFIIHEVHIRSILEYTRAYGIYDYMPVNGKYQAPDLPGIGQELNEQAIKEAKIHIIVKD